MGDSDTMHRLVPRGRSSALVLPQRARLRRHVCTAEADEDHPPKVVYHWKAKDFRGGSIVDLYTLKKRSPELFEGQSAKYQATSARKYVLSNTIIPNLGCLWNAAIHTSTIHPQLILDAKRRHGLPVDSA